MESKLTWPRSKRYNYRTTQSTVRAEQGRASIGAYTGPDDPDSRSFWWYGVRSGYYVEVPLFGKASAPCVGK